MEIEDLLLMRFTLIDPDDPEREFSIVIDVSRQEYSGEFSFSIDAPGPEADCPPVPNCSPPLPTLPELVRQLNTDRAFFEFIKRGKL